MKGADLPGSAATVPPAATNGTHRAGKKNGAKQSSRPVAHTDERPGPEPPAAPFSTSEPEPIDSPMWPLHSGLWFQPELAPSPPAWSGLAIERHNRIPAPDFLHSGVAPVNRTDVLENSCDTLAPAACPKISESGLAPLGWDPRSVCRPAVARKEECA